MKTFAGQAHRGLLALVIVSVASGCDNVEWGGTEFEIIPPPPSVVMATPDSTQEGSAEMGLPTGPVLFHLIKTPGNAQLLIQLAPILMAVGAPAAEARKMFIWQLLLIGVLATLPVLIGTWL